MKMKSKVFTVISAFVFLAALVVFSAVTVRTVRAQSLQDAKQQQLLLLFMSMKSTAKNFTKAQ